MTTTAVIKLGGQVVRDDGFSRRILEELVSLVDRGWRIVLVHGGSPQVDELQRRVGIRVHKVGGRRVTDAATLLAATQVLAGEVNVQLVAAARRAGLAAVGLSGVSVIEATRRAVDKGLDYGWVGTVVAADAGPLRALLDGGYVPVVAPMGRAVDTAQAGVYNINADTIAGALAGAMSADHLFLVTSVDGVLADARDPASGLGCLTPEAARASMATGSIRDGMLPKVASAVQQIEHGVGVVHIVGPGMSSLELAAAEPGRHGTALVGRSQGPAATPDPAAARNCP